MERAERLASAKGRTAAQIALAWLFRQGMNVFALVGCATHEEFAENASALDVELSEEDTRWLGE